MQRKRKLAEKVGAARELDFGFKELVVWVTSRSNRAEKK
jgi:hypothetical protein